LIEHERQGSRDLAKKQLRVNCCYRETLSPSLSAIPKAVTFIESENYLSAHKSHTLFAERVWENPWSVEHISFNRDK